MLHDVISHDKLFQHILVGATSTSAPTSTVGAANVYNSSFSRIFYDLGGGAHSFAGEGVGVTQF